MRTLIATTVFRLCLLFALATACVAQSASHGQPVARIGGEAIYDEDLMPFVRAQMLQLKQQEFEMKSKALDNLVNQRLLESEAKRENLSAEALLTQKVDSRVAAPTDKELEAFYLPQKERIGRPFQEVKPQLEQALVQARRQQARQEYLDGLRRGSQVTILLARPRIEVAVDPARLRGNPQASVTIVEFSDFQCPYCRAAQPVVKDILSKYKDKVRLSYRDYPLRQIHPLAQQAAEASRCAADQGKFWEFHDLLYSDDAKLDQSGLTVHARSAGLDADRFTECLTSGRFKNAIEDDVQTGVMAGVSGTPAFYVNGVMFTGAQSAATFERIIETELAASGAEQRRP